MTKSKIYNILSIFVLFVLALSPLLFLLRVNEIQAAPPEKTYKDKDFQAVEEEGTRAVYRVDIDGAFVQIIAHLDIKIKDPTQVDKINISRDFVRFDVCDDGDICFTYVTSRNNLRDVNVVHDSIYTIPGGINIKYIKISVDDGGGGTEPRIIKENSYIKIRCPSDDWQDYRYYDILKNETSHEGLAGAYTAGHLDGIYEQQKAFSHAGAWGGKSSAKVKMYQTRYFDSVKTGNADIKISAGWAGVANLIGFGMGGGKYAYSITSGASFAGAGNKYKDPTSNGVLVKGKLDSSSDGFDDIGSGLKQMVGSNIAQNSVEKGVEYAAKHAIKYAKFCGKAAKAVPVIGTIIDIAGLGWDLYKFYKTLEVDKVAFGLQEDVPFPTVSLSKGEPYAIWLAFNSKVEASGVMVGTGHAYVDFLNNKSLRTHDKAGEKLKGDDWGVFLFDTLVYYYPDEYPLARINSAKIWQVTTGEERIIGEDKVVDVGDWLTFEAASAPAGKNYKYSWKILDKSEDHNINVLAGRSQEDVQGRILTSVRFNVNGAYQIVLEVTDADTGLTVADSMDIEVRPLPSQPKILKMEPFPDRIKLTWDQNKDKTFDSYRVYIQKRDISKDPEEDWEFFKKVYFQDITSVEVTEYKGNSLLEDTHYCLKVAAEDIWGRKTFSKIYPNEPDKYCVNTTSFSAPPAITLEYPDILFETALTLSWSKSALSDEEFSHYEVHASDVSHFQPDDSTKQTVYIGKYTDLALLGQNPQYVKDIPYQSTVKADLIGLMPASTYYLKVCVVNDKNKKGCSDQRIVTMKKPDLPIAVPGPDRAILANYKMNFDGSKSYDPQGRDILLYEWKFFDKTGNGTGAPTSPAKSVWQQQKIEDIKFLHPGTYEACLRIKVRELSGNEIESAWNCANVLVRPMEPYVSIKMDNEVISRPVGSPDSITLFINSKGIENFIHVDVCWYRLSSSGQPGGKKCHSTLNNGQFITQKETSYTIDNLSPDQLYVFGVSIAVEDYLKRKDEKGNPIQWASSTEIKQRTDIQRRDLTFLEYLTTDPKSPGKQINVSRISNDTFKFNVNLLDKGDAPNLANKSFKVKFSYKMSGRIGAEGVIDEQEIKPDQAYALGTPIPLFVTWFPPGEGPYEIIAEIDSGNEHDERAESNNIIVYEPLDFSIKKEGEKEDKKEEGEKSEAGTTPDSPFYFVDRAMEGIRSFFTFNKVKKVELQLKFAEERLAETKEMVDKNKLDSVSSLVEDYKKNIDKAGELIASAEKRGEDVETVQWLIVEKTTKNSEALNELKEKVSEETKSIIDNTVNDLIEKRGSVLKNLIKIPKTEVLEPEFEPEPGPEPQPEPQLEPKPEPEPEPLQPSDEGEGQAEPESEPEPEGPVCGDGKCETGENCSNCGSDCACGTEKVCQNGNCVEVECTSNANCDDNKACTQDTCVNNACQHQCQTGQDCNDGNNLTINDTCVEQVGQCICKGETIECYNDSNCNDNNSCTVDTCHNAGTSNASCSHTAITSCINNDGCCPLGCNSTNDNNCEAACGNGVCETGENYDNCSSDCEPELVIECHPETEDADCEDDDPCTDWMCEAEYNESWEIVRSSCSLYHTITECYMSSDGCCPEGCTYPDDPDCAE